MLRLSKSWMPNRTRGEQIDIPNSSNVQRVLRLLKSWMPNRARGEQIDIPKSLNVQRVSQLFKSWMPNCTRGEQIDIPKNSNVQRCCMFQKINSYKRTRGVNFCLTECSTLHAFETLMCTARRRHLFAEACHCIFAGRHTVRLPPQR